MESNLNSLTSMIAHAYLPVIHAGSPSRGKSSEGLDMKHLMQDKIYMGAKGILSPDKNSAYGYWEKLDGRYWNALSEVDTAIFKSVGLNIMGRDGHFKLPFLGKTLIIQRDVRQMVWETSTRTPTFQEGLVALSYLAHFKPVSLSQKWVAPSELPGGRTFFSAGSHPPATGSILNLWDNHHAAFLSVLSLLHGSPIPAGDEGIQIPCLPFLPIRYIFWKGDAQFPSSVTLIVNATAHLFLPLDVLWALINLTDCIFEEAVAPHHFSKR